MPNAKRTIKGKLEKYEPRVERLPGLLGDDYGVVRVPGQDGYVYYRTPTGDVHTAWNDRVQNTPNLPIFYGMLNRRMQILETRDVYITPNRAQNIPEHGFNHAWPAGDTVPVWPEQFKAWGLDPVSGLTVRLYQGTIYLPDDTLVHVSTTDITLAMPAPATGAIYALISVSTIGAISVTYGTPAVDSMELLTLANIPSTTGIPLWAVRLYDGQVNITRGATTTDLIDLRFAYPSSVSSKDLAATIHAATAKNPPIDTDETALVDSAATFGLKKLTWAVTKSTLKTYFDGIYTAIGGGAGGNDHDIQFNNAGILGGDDLLKWVDSHVELGADLRFMTDAVGGLPTLRLIQPLDQTAHGVPGSNIRIQGGKGLGDIGDQGSGGSITIQGGDGVGNDGGQVTIKGGNPTDAGGAGGSVRLDGADSLEPNAAGGGITMQCGKGSVAGGNILANAGDAIADSDGRGGAGIFQAGYGDGDGNGGDFEFWAGWSLGDGDGGDFLIGGGGSSGTGDPGVIKLYSNDNAQNGAAVLDTHHLATDRLFEFPDKDGTLAMLDDIPAFGGDVTYLFFEDEIVALNDEAIYL